MMTLRCRDTDHRATASQPAKNEVAIERAILQTLAYADIFD
jgi:hypothetical protein